MARGSGSPGSLRPRVQVIHGREFMVRCKKCGSQEWRIAGEIRREEKDNPQELQVQATRVYCVKCDSWMYLDEIIKPRSPVVDTSKDKSRVFLPATGQSKSQSQPRSTEPSRINGSAPTRK